MELHEVGRGALLAEVRDTAEALGLATWSRGRIEAVEIVPAARTVLFDGLDDVPAVARALRDWQGTDDAARTEGPLVEIPVTYDGDDLAAVAELWGTDRDGVIERHTSIDFVSAFCGFAPGFAYLAGLPAELEVPRLRDPRSRVPAGSVGLADTWCGVYPTASPGGWQLIGRTDAVLWDVEADPPALLAPGTRVRFRDAASPSRRAPASPSSGHRLGSSTQGFRAR